MEIQKINELSMIYVGENDKNPIHCYLKTGYRDFFRSDVLI